MPVPRIAKEDLKQRLETSDEPSRPLLLDVRKKYPYEHSGLRLPGAIRMGADALDLAALPRGRDIVAYDSDPDEIVSSAVAARLIRSGFRASALKGGIAEWITANYPVEPKEGPNQAPAAPGPDKV